MEIEKKSVFEEGQILLFDKPLYWTSFDLVNKVRLIIRNILGIRKIKVGHAGTLDPLASGLLIICTGKSTKKIDLFRDLDKEYVAVIHIGETTPSYDLETEVSGHFPVEHITEELVKKVLHDFEGEQKQVPPLHSAKMIEGKRAYSYARQGIERVLEPVTVYFHETELLSFCLPEVKIRLRCSKGTYIRSFARDFGLALGSGAYLSGLVRTSIGEFSLKDAISLEKFQEKLEGMKQI
jgi:tRNA pseudouridine55 synthase